MGRSRTREYIDVYIKEAEFKRLKKGLAVHRYCKNNLGISIKLEDRKINRKIAKLEAQIKALKNREEKSI